MPGQVDTDGPVISHAEPVMGTVASFAVVPGIQPGHLGQPGQAATTAIQAACAVLHEANAIFSTWDPQSPVSRLRRGEAAPGDLPEAVGEVLDLCASARRMSGGWFDPWAMPGGFDPTGLVKGWAVDQALGVLREAGMTAAMINGGGDVAVYGSPAPGDPWRIGIRHPWRSGALAAILEVPAAVATSGTYERGGHLISPFTGRPGGKAVSATVTGPCLALADALATALAIGGDEMLDIVSGLDGYDGYLIRADGSEESTPGIAFVMA